MSWVSRFARWLGRKVRAAPPSLWSERVEEAPDQLQPHLVYLIGDTRDPWSAAFLCPCGCGDTILLSLIRDDDPRWRARTHWDGTVSLHPSVWRRRGCRSHFFVIRGRVVWVPRRFDEHY